MTGAAFLNTICGSATIMGLADKSASDTVYRASALGWFNLVQKDISNRQQNFHWRFLEKQATFATAVNDFDYSIATIAADLDTTKMVAVYDKTYDRTYRYVDYLRFRRSIADETNNSGQAYLFSFFAGNLLLYPRPSAIVTTYIDYIKLITDLTDAATTGDIPSKYDDVVISGVLVYVYRIDPQLGSWSAQQIVYEAGVQRMIQDNNMVIGELPYSGSHRDSVPQDIREGNDYIYLPRI
jgi:hypothetical protein